MTMKKNDLLTLIFLVATINAFGQFNRNLRTIEPVDTSYYKEYVKAQKKIKPAEYPGGMASFYKFVSKRMKIPKDAKRQQINGKVYVQFKIDSIGNIPTESIKVVGPLFESCDKEAVRLISKSSPWIPAMNIETNEKIESYKRLAILFLLKN
jgi:Gram-negative bacterial TonB protein C-terminal